MEPHKLCILASSPGVEVGLLALDQGYSWQAASGDAPFRLDLGKVESHNWCKIALRAKTRILKFFARFRAVLELRVGPKGFAPL